MDSNKSRKYRMHRANMTIREADSNKKSAPLIVQLIAFESGNL